MKCVLSKKVLVFVITLVFVSVSCVTSITSDKLSILDVGNSFGDTLYVGGNDPGCYDTIQSAIDAAKSGDTIFVYDDSSPYYENIVIGKSLDLVGENRDTTIVDGGGSGDVVYITVDRINISGFTIRNSGNKAGINVNSDYNIISDNILGNNGYGIQFEYSHNNVVFRNKIMNDGYGIYLYDSFDIDIYENTIIDNSIGIQLHHHSKDNVIYGNDITNNEQGINLNVSSYTDIYWNIITDSHYGIYSYDSSNNDIHDDNIITDNIYGIYFYHSSTTNIYGGNTIADNDNCGIYLYDSSNINIRENDITNNKHGINLDVSSDNDIYWNNIRYNKYGIYFYHSSNNNVYLNNIEDNYQIGLYIFFSSNSRITYNNFIDNYKPAYFKQELFSFNIWKKNYWDSWDGAGSYKIDGEIEGIISRSWLNFDIRPVKQPYDI